MIDKEKEISKVTIDNTSVPLYEKPTQTKNITPTTREQVVNADDGYNLSSVTVEAVTSDIDSNILPTNIRQGVTILGVDGNLAPDKPDQSKSVNPTTSQQVVVADTGYELAQVTVNAVTNDIDSNIIPENIKEGVSILGVEGNLKSGGGENKLPALVDRSITNITGEDLQGATSIGANAFASCSALTSITIPNSVTSIGDSAFSGCSSLTDVYYAGDVNDWVSITRANSAYANPLSYADNLYLNGNTTTPVTSINIDTATSISRYSFYGFVGLQSLTIGNQVTSIGTRAFGKCSELTNVTLEEGITNIEDNTFFNCPKLESITIPDSVTSIGESAFSNCSGLTSITIPDSVTSIGYGAFHSCSGLTSITIGNSVTSIGDSAFNNCTALTEINFNAINMNNLSSNNYVFYRAGQGGNGITVNIGANVTRIPTRFLYPFSGSANAPKIVIINFADDSQCNSIGSYAFAYLDNLTSITFPNSINNISDNAFTWCTSLISVTFQGQVPNIQSNTFYLCNAVTKYDFRNCITVPTLANTNSLGHASGCQIIIPDALYDTWTTSNVWSSLTNVTFVKASEVIE